MAFAYAEYEGDFIQTTFAIPFGYILPSHVIVTLDGVPQLIGVHITISAGLITFFTAPPAGKTIIVKRNSSQSTLLTQYQDGMTLNSGPLTVDSEQAFYMAQEALDEASGGGGSQYLPLTGGQMTGQLLLSGAPTQPTSAATKQYVDDKPSLNALGGWLVNNILPSSTYTFNEFLNLGSPPYAGHPSPTTGNGSTGTKYVTNLSGRSGNSSTSVFTVNAYSTSTPPPAAMSFQVWVWYPIMFTKTMTFRYIGVDCAQGSAGAPWGRTHLIVYNGDAATLTPTTVLVDGGVQTLPVQVGGSFSTPCGLGNWHSIGSTTFTAGVQYWVALNLGLSTGSTTNTVSFRINTMSGAISQNVLYNSMGTSASSSVSSAWGASHVWVSNATSPAPGSQLLGVSPGDNPLIQNVGIAPNYLNLTNVMMPIFLFCT